MPTRSDKRDAIPRWLPSLARPPCTTLPGCYLSQYSTDWLTVGGDVGIFNLMVDEAAMNTVFHALAHEARRAMLARLASGDLTVGRLAEPFAMSLEAASKHIRVLERAGLVRRTIEGRRHVCRLAPKPLASAYDWLRFYEHFWKARLDSLERLLSPRAKRRSKT